MTNFSYNRNIPNGPNNPSADQPLMQTNTNSIEDIINVDHVSFGLNNGGFHRQTQLLNQAAIPPGLINGEGTLYTKAVAGVSQLFYSPDTSGNEYPLTRAIPASAALFATTNPYGTPPAGFTQIGGWIFLPGGLLMQYGFYGKTLATGMSGQIQFPIAFTTGNFSLQMTLYRDSGNQTLNLNSLIPPTTTTFNFLTSSAGSDGISWQAIGI